MMTRKFTVKRSQWLRGTGNAEVVDDHHASYLLNPVNGKMCCWGFYCLAAGAKKKDIRRVGDLNGLGGIVGLPNNNDEIDDPVVRASYAVNDSDNLDDHSRETVLKLMFSTLGIEVKFED